jgi:hypothetical protein
MALMSALVDADVAGSESESESSLRQYRRSSATAFDMMHIHWDAGNMITQPISMLGFMGDFLISAITSAITIVSSVLTFEGWCTCPTSASGCNGGMPVLLLLLPPLQALVGLAWWCAMMAKRIVPGLHQRDILCK